MRTQISLTEEERHVPDAAAARTGRSISALIRYAVETVYVAKRSVEEDLSVSHFHPALAVDARIETPRQRRLSRSPPIVRRNILV